MVHRLDPPRGAKAPLRPVQGRASQVGTTFRLESAGRPHPLKGDRLGQFSVDLQGAVRLVFESSQDPIPRNADKSIAWNQVNKVRIVFIGDYHD